MSTLSFNGTVLAGHGLTIPVADTGYTANSTAGDKTVVVAAYALGITGTMITALNVTSAGLGTALGALDAQMAAVTKKLAALETSAAALTIPNA